MSVLAERVTAPDFSKTLPNSSNVSPGTPSRSTRSTRSASSTSTANGGSEGERVLFIKGAPEQVLERCSFFRIPSGETVKLTDKLRGIILSRVKEWAGLEALRVLAVASLNTPSIPEGVQLEQESYAGFEVIWRRHGIGIELLPHEILSSLF